MSAILIFFYRIDNRFIRKIIRKIVLFFEGGELYSKTVRKIFKNYYNVDIGMYTYGGCFIPDRIGPYTKIGRYCSISYSSSVRNRNHPLAHKSTHPFFFNPKSGYCRNEIINYIPLEIGNDVWVGENSVILPNVKFIGDGAVIGAHAVVTKDVPLMLLL